MLPIQPRRHVRFLPYVLGSTVIFVGYLHFSFIVLEKPSAVKTSIGKVTFSQVQLPTKGIHDYGSLTRRAAKIKEICSKPYVTDLMGPYPSEHEKHLIVDDKTNTLFCYVPKVACTNFKRVFLGLAGVIQPSDVDTLSGYDVHFTHINRLKFLKDYSRLQKHKKTTTYQKFMFIRDPLERLVSAYRSKLVIHPNPDSRAAFLQKIEEFYIQFTQKEKERKVLKRLKDRTITFKDFLYYIRDHLELQGQVNEHFAPMVTLCNPCKVKYDFVGSYEGLNKEANYIFRKLHIPHQFPHRNDNYSSVETKQLVESYYSNLPPDLIRSVWEIFKKDYVIFDIPIPTWLLKYTI